MIPKVTTDRWRRIEIQRQRPLEIFLQLAFAFREAETFYDLQELIAFIVILSFSVFRHLEGCTSSEMMT